MKNLNNLSKNGKILMLALDHRGSLERLIATKYPPNQVKTLAIKLKIILMEKLAPYYTGVLFDQTYGLPAYNLSDNKELKNKPYLLCIEKTGYTDIEKEKLTELECSVSSLKKKGAKGVKLLIYFHPKAKTAKKQLETSLKVYKECQIENLPFFLEILTYPISSDYDKEKIIPASVKMFLENDINADVFKLEFPGSAETCRLLTKMLGKTPWILLTKGADFQDFKRDLEVAAKNGAKGFLAGRSLWQEFIDYPKDEWEEFITKTALYRFRKISAIFQS